MSTTEQPVADPTWMQDIRFFFEQIDIEHMNQLGIDLATYEGVKSRATSIYFQTAPPDAKMPPKPGIPWSQARSDTFKNWIVSGFPFGVAAPQPVAFRAFAAAVAAPGRVRKDVRSLSPAEIATLKAAFAGIMALDPSDPNSYFARADIHGLPRPSWCMHHENRYNPWHRTYLQSFEDALRTVPGCSDVTLPYWDITDPIPDLLYQTPFDKFTLPRAIGGGFEQGYVTDRNPAANIAQRLIDYEVSSLITSAMAASVWEKFARDIEVAHDGGHLSCGPTMVQPEVAAYDPIFWFFHANWDRLWWQWQQATSATTLAGFPSTVGGSRTWLSAPFNALEPFTDTAEQTIDLSTKYDVGYEHPQAPPPVLLARAFGSLPAAGLHKLHDGGRASVRVKGIDRLNIPGSFAVHLRAGGQTIARRAFFQAKSPRTCSNCVKRGLVDLDFEVAIDRLRGTPLSVAIELVHPDRISPNFPLSSAGDPSINVRLLLE